MTTRKKYSKEYKLDSVSLVLDQGYTITNAAKSLDVNRSVLQRWIKEFESDDGDGQAFRGNGKLTLEQAEIRRLTEENRRLKMEKEILIKRSSSPRKLDEVSVYHPIQEDLACRSDVSITGCYTQWLLQLLSTKGHDATRS